MNQSDTRPFPVWRPTLLGAAGGTINGLLLWLKLPVGIPMGFPVGSDSVDFAPAVIPCGTFHGAALAAFAIIAANLCLRHPRLCLPIWLAAGYLAGWISWAPWHFSEYGDLLKALTWPFSDSHPAGGHPAGALIAPYWVFGLVALILAACMSVLPSFMRRSLWTTLGMTVPSGILGSLWYWATADVDPSRWFFAPIHGSIWGLLIGLGFAWGSPRQPN